MLKPFNNLTPAIQMSTDLTEAVEAAKKFVEQGYYLRDFVIDTWIDRSFKDSWYWDGTEKAHFKGTSDTEQFSNWLQYVCDMADVPAPVRSGLRTMCIKVIPMIETEFIQQTLSDFTEITDSKMGRTVSAINGVIKKHEYTPQASKKIDGIIAMARGNCTVVEFEEWLVVNGFSNPRTTPPTKDPPAVIKLEGANGAIYIIHALYGSQNDMVQSLTARWEPELVDYSEGVDILQEVLKQDGPRVVPVGTWDEQEEDII